MKVFWWMLFALGVGTTAVSQVVIREIKSSDFTFPVVELPDEEAALKINDYLQTNLLQQTTLKNTGAKLFEKAKYTLSHPGIEALDYEIKLKNKKLLSLVFYGDATGAYPQPFSQAFLFN